MNLSEYLKSSPRGELVSISREIHSHPSTVFYWANGIRPIPIHHCVAIERATGGQVTRQELRPDDWWKIWPELADGAAWPDGIARTVVEGGDESQEKGEK